MQSSSRRSRSRVAPAPAEGGKQPRALCHLVSEGLSRSDVMRPDGSFLQDSSLPLIHPYHTVNPSSYRVPLKNRSAYWSWPVEQTGAALIKDHLALVQISLIECQSGMFAWRQESGPSFKGPLPCTHEAFVLVLLDTEWKVRWLTLSWWAVCVSCPLAELNKDLFISSSVIVWCFLNGFAPSDFISYLRVDIKDSINFRIKIATCFCTISCRSLSDIQPLQNS